jgi:hypothetical protein
VPGRAAVVGAQQEAAVAADVAEAADDQVALLRRGERDAVRLIGADAGQLGPCPPAVAGPPDAAELVEEEAVVRVGEVGAAQPQPVDELPAALDVLAGLRPWSG